MRVFMSTPFSGKTQRGIDEECGRVKNLIRKLKICPETETITVVHNFNTEKDPNNRLYTIGEAIKLIGTCDFFVFMPGWESRMGCKVERYVTEHYFVPERIIEIESITEME